MNGYRARRIEDYVASKSAITFEDHRAMHVDFTCLPGHELIALLDGLDLTDPHVKLAVDHLKAWDCQLTPESVWGTLYEVARLYLVRIVLEAALDKEMTARIMSKGFHPLLLPTHEFSGQDTVAVLRILNNPESWWLQRVKGKNEVLSKSMKEAVSWLRAELGDDPDSWKWGRLRLRRQAMPCGATRLRPTGNG